MEQRNDPVLCIGPQIDEEIAAGEQIHLGEGRISQHIVRRENDVLAQLLLHPVPAVFLHKEPFQARRAHVVADPLGIEPLAGDVDRLGINVGGEDLEGVIEVMPAQVFMQQMARE